MVHGPAVKLLGGSGVAVEILEADCADLTTGDKLGEVWGRRGGGEGERGRAFEPLGRCCGLFFSILW